MAVYLSLRFARPSAANCVCPRWQKWWCNPNYFRHQTFATSTDAAVDDEHASTVSSSPWLMMPSACDNCNKQQAQEGELVPRRVHNFYSLAEGRVLAIVSKSSEAVPEPEPDAYCVGSSYGCVGFINRRPDFDFFLSNPITGRNIKLPSILKLHVEVPNVHMWEEYQSFWSVIRAALSSPDPDAEDSRVLVHYQPAAKGKTRLAFCSPGCRDGAHNSSSWIPLDSPLGQYTHITYSTRDKRFFAMDTDFRIESWDLSDLSNPKRHPVINIQEDIEQVKLCSFWDPLESAINLLKNKDEKYRDEHRIGRKSYLVADPSLSGQLFLIHRFISHDVYEGSSGVLRRCHGENNINPLEPYKTLSFVVYKVDTTNKTLEYMDSLDDRALFIGLNDGLVLSAKDYPAVQPNSIYFSDDLNYGRFYGSQTGGSYMWIQDYEHITYGGHDIGIYNYQDKSIEGCYYPVQVEQCEKLQPSPVWLTPTYV